MPEPLNRLLAGLPGWLVSVIETLVVATIVVAAALALHHVLFRVLRRVVMASESKADDIVVRHIARPARYAMVALALVLAAREAPALATVWEKVAGFVMPAMTGWIAFAILHALVETLDLREDISATGDAQARRRKTRLTIFARIGSFGIIFITVGLMLFSIPGVRTIGVTLMASAGLAGLAVGAAAQPALKSMIAGLQMAITEPIAIDDVVIIDGQWGRIEDIRTTHVILRTWDARRLVVPTIKFLEETFENWTKGNPALIAPVILHLDPMTEIAPLRAEFERQLSANPLWDKREASLLVTDMSPQGIEVRLAMSAANSSVAWDLRCSMRESMLAWLRVNCPEAFARRRVESAATPREAAAVV